MALRGHFFFSWHEGRIEMSELEISGMSCPHCVKSVESALAAVPGVESVSVDLAGGRARVEGPAPAGELLAAVRQAGYEARVLANPG